MKYLYIALTLLSFPFIQSTYSVTLTNLTDKFIKFVPSTGNMTEAIMEEVIEPKGMFEDHEKSHIEIIRISSEPFEKVETNFIDDNNIEEIDTDDEIEFSPESN